MLCAIMCATEDAAEWATLEDAAGVVADRREIRVNALRKEGCQVVRVTQRIKVVNTLHSMLVRAGLVMGS